MLIDPPFLSNEERPDCTRKPNESNDFMRGLAIDRLSFMFTHIYGLYASVVLDVGVYERSGSVITGAV